MLSGTNFNLVSILRENDQKYELMFRYKLVDNLSSDRGFHENSN